MKKSVGIFLALFFVFTTIFGSAMYFSMKPEVEKAVNEEKLNKEKPENTFENLDVSNYKERVNVLLLGVDTLETAKDQTGTRSDTIMILSVDPVSKTGFILSVPRDSHVKIHGTEDYTKITHAHSYGGTQLAIDTVKDFVDIPIHHYMKVDYKALFKAIDDLGGVEFDVPIDMKYKDSASDPPLNINLKAGMQTLNAEQAMGLLRFRMGYPDKDFGRMRTQQAFIETVLKKLASPAALPTIPKHIETIYEYVETDMTITDVMSLMKIGLSLDLSMVQKATLPGEPDRMPNGASIIVVDEEKKKELLDYLLSGNYEVPEEKEDTSAENTTNDDKKSEQTGKLKKEQKPEDKEEKKEPTLNDKHIVVLNGSGKRGTARRASDLLKIQDILVDASGNASSFDNETTIIYYKDDIALANRIREILKIESAVKKGTEGLSKTNADIVVILGKDFS